MSKSSKTVGPISVFAAHLGDINKAKPINLRAIGPVIDRIQEQYPFVDRTTIVFVVKRFFEEFRAELLRGRIVTIESCILNAHIVSHQRKLPKLDLKPLKVKVNTPKHLR